MLGTLSTALARQASACRLCARRPTVRQARSSWHGRAESQGITFVGSFTDARKMPSLALPEVMLAGRSNVGKSSALNTLSGRRKKIAVVSKQPGR
jgi:GTP1/Obg family GTP-binding protein